MENSPDAWIKATSVVQQALATLDDNRGQLAPIFNINDSTMVAIAKGELLIVNPPYTI